MQGCIIAQKVPISLSYHRSPLAQQSLDLQRLQTQKYLLSCREPCHCACSGGWWRYLGAMTSDKSFIHLPDADATAALAARLSESLLAGDVILLSGPVGAGKTQFARALIQSILIHPEDVPSPTFTLVQTYETTHGLLWHTDLYRVTADSEIDELGLLEAFEEAICLVEWPDRLGPMRPQDALGIDLVPTGDARTATLSWSDPRWAKTLAQVVQNA